jgi:hypothetical protein
MIMDSASEPLLSQIPMHTEVIDRRPWLAGNWITAAWKKDKSALESLSLVRVEAPEKPRS